MKINTIPNWITLTRFVLYIGIMIILLGNIGSLKLIILPGYIMVFLMDKLDGYVARRYKMESDVGKFFDLATDRVIVTTLLICYVYFFPNVWVLAILLTNLIRDFMVGGLRQLAALHSIFMKAHIMGKIKFITENLSVILMVTLLSLPITENFITLTHRIIIGLLIIGSVMGWGSFYLYFKQVIVKKEK
jgi:CDP-diacylglycerol---glycerol-3-phosphate 3-phosphatidyltransferase